MKVLLIKLTNIHDASQWQQAVVGKLGLGEALSLEICQQLAGRDQLGSVQISPEAVLPHLVNDQLADSYFIVSQLNEPIFIAP